MEQTHLANVLRRLMWSYDKKYKWTEEEKGPSEKKVENFRRRIKDEVKAALGPAPALHSHCIWLLDQIFPYEVIQGQQLTEEWKKNNLTACNSCYSRFKNGLDSGNGQLVLVVLQLIYETEVKTKKNRPKEIK